jgi:pyrroline-5-carboxylate reductase
MQLTIIGAGNMGGAIAQGLFNHKSAEDNLHVAVADISQEKLAAIAPYCNATFTDNAEAVAKADIVLIAVKPWLVDIVLDTIKPVIESRCPIIVSIAAGVTINHLLERLQASYPVYRLIPNTAISIAESMTLIANQNTNDEQDKLIGSIFEKLGKTLFIPESLMNAATALTSCGIAYALRYIRAATEGGVEMGFPAAQAKEMVAQTLIGAAQLILQNDSHPEVEIDKVTTPGGITIKGLNAMEAEGFTNAVIKGLKASLI